MKQWKISIPIKGLYNIIKETNSELTIDNNVKFHYRGNEHIASVTIDSDTDSYAIKEAKYVIDKSLAKICFAYNTETSISGNGYYVVDLSDKPGSQKIVSEHTDRWSNLKEDPKTTLSNIASLNTDKSEVMDLAFAYYKLGEYNNPLRIESFFSCMTVIVRKLVKNDNEYISTSELKNKIKDILKLNNSKFDESQFERDWKKLLCG